MSRIVIFTGRFGSGKTETSLNYATALSRASLSPPSLAHGERVALVDLDVVTPYFRSREMALGMSRHGVEVIAPLSVSRRLDLPAISPQILGALQNDGYRVVLDVGGDPQGARALGQFSATLESVGYDMLMVVNPYRPFTNSAEGIARAIREIEAASRLKVGALVSNPNLMDETTPEVIERGHAVVEAASRQTGLPVEFAVAERSLVEIMVRRGFPIPVLAIERHMSAPWN